MENAQSEPSMEEILASIRRIISEDEEQAPQPSAGDQPTTPTLVHEAAEPEQAVSAPVEPVAAPAKEDHLKVDDVEMIKQNVAEAVQEDAGEAIMSDDAASAASSAFANLSETVRVSDGPGRTLEDIVTAMLQPMIKEWLDANLPAIVEEKVEEEVQRVARRRR